MAGPPPAIGPLSFEAFRASASELPENFVSRLESGLDETVKSSLETGLRVLRELRSAWRLNLAGFIFGAMVVILGGAISRRMPLLADYLLFHGAGTLLFAGIASLYVACFTLRYRRDIHRVAAFVRAMRESSLARDIG